MASSVSGVQKYKACQEKEDNEKKVKEAAKKNGTKEKEVKQAKELLKEVS